MFGYSKEVFCLVKGLSEYREDPIGLASWALTDTFGYFFLEHTGKLRNECPDLKELKDYLGGDIIGEVSYDRKRFFGKVTNQVERKKILG